MTNVACSAVDPGQRRLNGPQTTGREYRNLSQPTHTMAEDDDVPVPMRDGVMLLADVHRPAEPGRYPVLVAASPYPRQIQNLGAPAGFIEAGASDCFVPRGYVHVTVTLAISPDNSMIVTHYFFMNPRTMVTDRSGASFLFAVSDYELDRRGISVLHAFFTPDSRYLLLLSNLPAIYIYDTRTWEPVNDLPAVPAGATAFYPSSDWKHGIAVLRNGEIEVWDVSKGQKRSDLDLQGDLQEVSFSKDDSLFAVSSVRHNADSSSTFRLRVWDTNTGQFVREMIPPYYFEHDVISRPMWWGDGKYLLANIRAGHSGGYMIAVWNVQTGQLRGGFSACDSSQDPFEVGIDGPQLLNWCFDEALLVWDIPTAIDEVTQLEESLSRP